MNHKSIGAGKKINAQMANTGSDKNENKIRIETNVSPPSKWRHSISPSKKTIYAMQKHQTATTDGQQHIIKKKETRSERGSNTSGSNTSGSNTSGSNTSGSNTSGSNTSGSNTNGSNTSGSNTSGKSDPTENPNQKKLFPYSVLKHSQSVCKHCRVGF